MMIIELIAEIIGWIGISIVLGCVIGLPALIVHMNRDHSRNLW